LVVACDVQLVASLESEDEDWSEEREESRGNGSRQGWVYGAVTGSKVDVGLLGNSKQQCNMLGLWSVFIASEVDGVQTSESHRYPWRAEEGKKMQWPTAWMLC
jgi:hypothetical protein